MLWWRRPRRRQGLALKDAADRLSPLVVETHAVQSGPLRRQPEQARPRVARLAMPGHGAELGEAEAEQMPEARRHSVLVETGRQAHRGEETTAEQGLLQAQVAALQLTTQTFQRGAQQRPVAPQAGLAEQLQAHLAELLSVGSLVAAEQRADEAAVERSSAGLSHPVRPHHGYPPILTRHVAGASDPPRPAAPASRASSMDPGGPPGV